MIETAPAERSSYTLLKRGRVVELLPSETVNHIVENAPYKRIGLELAALDDPTIQMIVIYFLTFTMGRNNPTIEDCWKTMTKWWRRLKKRLGLNGAVAYMKLDISPSGRRHFHLILLGVPR